MKITISDTPRSRSSGIVNEAITKEQYEQLTKLGAAFLSTVGHAFSKEIEAVKIEAAYIDKESKMTKIRITAAFNPFVRFGEHHCTKIVRLHGLWEVDHKLFWCTDKEMDSGISFPRNNSQRFELRTDRPEEIADYLLESLARVLEKIKESLIDESNLLQEEIDGLRFIHIRKGQKVL